MIDETILSRSELVKIGNPGKQAPKRNMCNLAMHCSFPGYQASAAADIPGWLRGQRCGHQASADATRDIVRFCCETLRHLT